KDKDGFYTIMLHDFSGEAQAVAQFASKGDAHQALYAILQALLSQKEQVGTRSACSTGSKCCGFFKDFLKTIAYLLLFVFLVYACFFVYYGYIAPSATRSSISDTAAQTSSQQTSSNDQAA